MSSIVSNESVLSDRYTTISLDKPLKLSMLKDAWWKRGIRYHGIFDAQKMFAIIAPSTLKHDWIISLVDFNESNTEDLWGFLFEVQRPEPEKELIRFSSIVNSRKSTNRGFAIENDTLRESVLKAALSLIDLEQAVPPQSTT